MRYFKFCTLLLLVTLFTNCKTKNNPTENPSTALRFEEHTLNKKSSTCDTDSTRCAMVEATYPIAVEGKPEAMQAVNDTIMEYIKMTLAFGEGVPKTAEEAADSFIQSYETFIKDYPDSPAPWEIQTNGKVTYQSEKYISIEISNYSYAGGAHPNSFVNLLTFDANSGKKLTITDIVSDTAQLKQLAEVKFRAARELAPDANLAEEGFFWDGPFMLSANFSATGEGLYFVYNPYEAAAYAAGPTEFTISYEELKGILKE